MSTALGDLWAVKPAVLRRGKRKQQMRARGRVHGSDIIWHLNTLVCGFIFPLDTWDDEPEYV